MKLEVGTKVKIIERKKGDFLHMYTGDKLGKLGTIAEYDSISEAYRVLLDGADKPTLWSDSYLEVIEDEAK